MLGCRMVIGSIGTQAALLPIEPVALVAPRSVPVVLSEPMLVVSTEVALVF
jgi:hypothetical protein